MPFQQITVQNAPVNVFRSGAGRPLLMLHGNPDTHRTWLPIIERLPPGFESIAPDLPGFGESGIPDQFDPSLDGMVRWMDELVDGLGLSAPFDLAVHDIGGIVGLAWVARNPGRVRRLIITNTIFQSDYRWHFWARIWRRPGLGELSMKLLGLPLLGRELLGVTMRLGGPGLSRAQRNETYDNYHRRARAQVLTLYRATDPENFKDWEDAASAAVAKIPSRVIWGAKDIYIPQRFASRFGSDDVHVIADAGHWVMAEAPVSVTALMVEHLQDD